LLTYAGATAACAFVPNIWFLFAFRFVASLGIGGEWAAGASLVAETVPPARRVFAGALLLHGRTVRTLGDHVDSAG